MLSIIAKLGRMVLSFLQQTGEIINLFFSVLKYLPRIFKDRRLILEQMAIVGADSLPLVLLIGLFTGAISALEATSLFTKFNLIEMAKPFIGSSIATAVFTELTPVLTALLIAGRVGGAMAAQIGTMNVSEQVDALEMMAIDRNRFLAAPRVLALMMMMPVLGIFSDIVALFGGFVLTQIKFGFSYQFFFESVNRYFLVSEILTGLLKTFVFGGVTALVSCAVGFKTTGGAEGVGNSTVKAYTISASAILVIDAIFGYIL